MRSFFSKPLGLTRRVSTKVKIEANRKSWGMMARQGVEMAAEASTLMITPTYTTSEVAGSTYDNTTVQHPQPPSWQPIFGAVKPFERRKSISSVSGAAVSGMKTTFPSTVMLGESWAACVKVAATKE